MQISGDKLPTVGIITLGIASYLNPLLQLARILQRQGYRVVFLSTNELVGSTAADNGYEFFHLDATPDAACIADARAAVAMNWLPQAMREDRAKARAAQAWLQKAGLGLPAFLQQQPACMLVMAELHEDIVFLTGQGVPLVVVDTHLASRRRPGIPPPPPWIPAPSRHC